MSTMTAVYSYHSYVPVPVALCRRRPPSLTVLVLGRYQVWLEAYLKNGKKRVSEVKEFVTKLGETGKAEEIKGDEKGGLYVDVT